MTHLLGITKRFSRVYTIKAQDQLIDAKRNLEMIWPNFRRGQIYAEDNLSVRIDFGSDGVHVIKPIPIQDLTLIRGQFEEIVEELRSLAQSSPMSCPSGGLLMEDYLWATARRVIKDGRRKVVTKHDIKSALYKRADIIL
ncbi:hypothetical protein CEXT_440751 [Caerostris extrusa]|uniref:Uncharacterized protein n=1 Tax=Caerostris extrusa TaxID=172846 RepID=A0AAV4R2U0_CAEEX|nr:hypothetical protein CEXT_440751 [Caerostris extrusa]